jgi:hypothetical protein
MKRLLLLSFLFCAVQVFPQFTIDFETTGHDYKFNVFSTGGDSTDFAVVDNPSMTGINTSPKVGRLVIHPTGDPWAGIWTNSITPFTITSSNAIVKMWVYKDVISDVNLKLEPPNIDHNVPNTVINQWEELTFDYTSHIGTTVNVITIIPDFQLPSRTSGSTNHFDNIDFGQGYVPVELVSFAGSAVGSEVHLNWQTATETNNYGFEIQRGNDNFKFETIGFVNGAGTVTDVQTYSFVDKNISGQKFYRLKQVDFDGSFDYSNVVEVNVVPSVYSLSQNYPNPFNPSTTIAFSLPQEVHVAIKVYNVLGTEVATLVNDVYAAGTHEVEFNASELGSGIYYYTINSGNFKSTKKLVLLK